MAVEDVASGKELVSRASYEALQARRRADLERLQRLTVECDALRLDNAEMAAEVREIRAKLVDHSVENVIIRLEPNALAAKPTLLMRILAALLLPFARRAATASQWEQAQVYYQCLALLRPRTFLWKQIGAMLYHQGIYKQAKPLFEVVLKQDRNDQDARHLLGECSDRIKD